MLKLYEVCLGLIFLSLNVLANLESFKEEILRSLNVNRKLYFHQDADFEIFIPSEIDDYGKIINRRRRSNILSQKLNYHFPAFQQKFVLNLQLNHQLLSPDLKYIARYNDNVVKEFPLDKVQNCFYNGEVLSHNKSFAAVSVCNGLNGIIRTGDGDYIIEAFPQLLHQNDNDRLPDKIVHVIYKYLPAESKSCSIYKMKNSFIKNSLIHPKLNTGNSKKLTVETAVFIDHPLYEYLSEKFPKSTEDNILRYVFTIINGIQLMFNYPSLTDIPIKFVLIKVEIWKTNKPGFDVTDSAEDYLKNFCPWQNLINSKDDSDPKHWDHAFLFTGYDIHSEGDYSTMGVAPMNGMCKDDASCTVSEALYYSSVFVGAHEAGHTFGIDHDGDGNDCDTEKYIMAPRDGPGQTSWSECSHAYFKEFIETGKGFCLLDENDSQTYNHEGDLPGQRHTIEEQCEMIFGEGTKHDPLQDLENICGGLSCLEGDDAYSLSPALEGSFCGSGKWCRMGKCVLWGNDGPLIQDGGWTEWSPFSKCSSGCIEGGNGISFSIRKCTNPRPNNGGKSCENESGRYKTCSSDSICKTKITLEDFARKICLDKPKEIWALMTGKGRQQFDDHTGGCLVWCEKANLNKYSEWGKYFPDGTSCNNGDLKRKAYCVQGKCQNFET